MQELFVRVRKHCTQARQKKEMCEREREERESARERECVEMEGNEVTVDGAVARANKKSVEEHDRGGQVRMVNMDQGSCIQTVWHPHGTAWRACHAQSINLPRIELSEPWSEPVRVKQASLQSSPRPCMHGRQGGGEDGRRRNRGKKWR